MADDPAKPILERDPLERSIWLENELRSRGHIRLADRILAARTKSKESKDD